MSSFFSCKFNSVQCDAKMCENYNAFDFREGINNLDKMNLAKFSEIFDKKKTFRPKKKFQPGTMKYSLHKQAQVEIQRPLLTN